MKKPIQTQGSLFQAVQLSRIFQDSKSFPDAVAKRPAEEIEAGFKALLAEFIGEYFEIPGSQTGAGQLAPLPMEQHIDRLWNLLERRPEVKDSSSGSLIPLPYPYVVPGGRFREIYYWDSYFTCEGLAASGRIDLVEGMVQNFAWLIDQYGHIPNGNRTYYLSRSQPPFLWKMLQILEREKGFQTVLLYLPQLEKELAFWNSPYRVVQLKDRQCLNRYWDERNVPREEAFAEDSALFEQVTPERQGEFYRSIRAAAESGWDFSSRWLEDGRSMTFIRSIDLLPVDLNALLFGMQHQLGLWLRKANDPRANQHLTRATARKKAIQKLFWDEAQGWFFDYSWVEKNRTGVWSLAGLYPLFCGVATPAQARQVAENIVAKFLKPGGLVTTLHETGQQWDSPNGWAPLQWVGVQGLLKYGHKDLALEIARRFVNLAEKVYQSTGKMMEKYNVCDLDLEAGGGEYPLQDGFGWTNGVVKAFLGLL